MPRSREVNLSIGMIETRYSKTDGEYIFMRCLLRITIDVVWKKTNLLLSKVNKLFLMQIIIEPIILKKKIAHLD